VFCWWGGDGEVMEGRVEYEARNKQDQHDE
jgi:hypothetical protein